VGLDVYCDNYSSIVDMVMIRGAPIMLWPIVSRPIIGAK